jgi:hypothetical protein
MKTFLYNFIQDEQGQDLSVSGTEGATGIETPVLPSSSNCHWNRELPDRTGYGGSRPRLQIQPRESAEKGQG